LPVIPGYQLLGELGRGGMGIVYRAKHLAMKRTVAIKMLPPHEKVDPLDVARFCTEAEAVAAIKHPYVVQVFEFAIHDSYPYMAMEYLPGGSLCAKLSELDGPMPPDDAAELIEKLARGVQAAHAQGIVHRDLKPGNVLYDKADEPRVTDFGLAKRVTSDLTKTNEVMGTPAYMAPEQANGRTKFTGPAADIYALGAILYECLTGSPPFAGDGDTWLILNRVINDLPTRPRDIVDGVPRDLELICLRCLEKSPEDRYPTATALADDLKRYLNHEPVSVRPPNWVERGVKWARRRPTTATAYALGVLVVCMAVIGSIIVALWMNTIDAKKQTDEANRDIRVQIDLTQEARNQALLRESEAKQSQQEVALQKVQVDEALRNETEAKESLVKTQQELISTKYFHDVALAHQEIAEGNIARVDHLLANCSKELRGWEWWHCHRLAHPEIASFTIPDCHELTFTANGEELVSFNHVTCNTEFRDVRTGAVIRKVPTAEYAGLRRWLSSNGQRLLRVHMDQELSNQPNPSTVKAGVATVWDTFTGKVVSEWKDLNGMFFDGSLSADGSTAVVIGFDDSCRMQSFDVKTGKKLVELNEPISSNHKSSLTADGQLALSDTLDENRFISKTIWETRTGKVKQKMAHLHNGYGVWIMNAKISPDGSHMIFISDKGNLGFWKVGEPQAFRYMLGVHTGTDSQIAFSPDGSLCATSGEEGGIRIWKTSTAEAVGVLHGHARKIHKLAFHPKDDRLISIDASGQCKVWRISGTTAVSHFEPPGNWQVPVAIDDRATKMFVPYIFPDEQNSLLFDRESKQKALVPKPAFIHDYVFQPGGELFAITPGSSTSNQLELRNSKTGQLVRKFELPDGMSTNISFSRDGNRVLASCGGKASIVWDVTSGKELARISSQHNGIVLGAISGDGKRIASVDAGSFANVYDVETGRKICELKVPAVTHIIVLANSNAIALNHDGSQLAIGTQAWKVYLYNLPAKLEDKPLRYEVSAALTAHAAPINALAFSPSGDRLVSGSADGTVKLWDPRTRLESVTLKMTNKEPVHRIQYTHDGNRLIVVGMTRGAKIFDGTSNLK